MTRDPRINPVPGDQLRLKGNVATVIQCRNPCEVYFEWNGEKWKCGLATWQSHVEGAEIVNA